MDKKNGNYQIIWNKDGFVVSSSPIPQGDEGSIRIVAKLNKSEWGERGQGL